MLPVIPSRCPIIDVAGGAQARGFHRRVLRPASRAGAFMQRAMAGLRALLGIRTVYDVHPSGIPLLTAVSLGRLCLCIYHRCDAFVSPHDHPYDYWTFPLTTYVENVMCLLPDIDTETARLGTKRQKVTAFLPHRRSAYHAHSILGRYDPNGYSYRYYPWVDNYVEHDRFDTKPGKVIEIVWRGRPYRDWFYKDPSGTSAISGPQFLAAEHWEREFLKPYHPLPPSPLVVFIRSLLTGQVITLESRTAAPDLRAAD